MSKLLVVFGATGQQGGSVVDYVLNDPELSKKFKVRALTRNPSGPGGQALAQKGTEVARLDYDDVASIKDAVKGAHTIFAMTSTSTPPQPFLSHTNISLISHSLRPPDRAQRT